MSGGQRGVHVLIVGRVQGVGYRAWAAARAAELGLSGFVRNRRSGGVEAQFSGEAGAVAAMLEKCRSGLPGAIVTGVEIVAEELPEATGFEIRPTV